MTTHGSQAIKYDTDNRLVRVDLSGTPIGKFSYDGDDTRRKRLDANGTIHYLGTYERNVGTGPNPLDVTTKYYVARFGGLSRLVAFRKGGTLYYVGTDHLGARSGWPTPASMRWTRCATVPSGWDATRGRA
jgi:hypothetical protein